MSSAKKCDRCAALYQPVQGCVWIDGYNIASEAKKRSDGPLWTGYEADLCPKCSAEFVAWLGVKYEADQQPHPKERS